MELTWRSWYGYKEEENNEELDVIVNRLQGDGWNITTKEEQ